MNTPNALPNRTISGRSPVRPSKDPSKRFRYPRSVVASSRAGSVVTNSMPTFLRCPSSSRVRAEAMFAITTWQMSGQWVYPKNTSVSGFDASVATSYGFPAASSRVMAGTAYGRGRTTPLRLSSSSMRTFETGAPESGRLPPQAARPRVETRARTNSAATRGLRTPDTVSEVTGKRRQGGKACRPVGVGVEQTPDEGGADDHPVGEPSDLGGLVPVGDAQPDSDGQVRDRTGPGHQGPGQVAAGFPRSGDAHHRGRVHEPPTGRSGHLQPLVGRGGRHQEDLVETVLVGGAPPGIGLVGHQVGGDEARPAGVGEVRSEPVDAVPLDRVPVGHHHRGHARLRDRLDDAEHVGGPDPALERLLRRRLDRRPVHDRVAVGQADLDDVTAGVDHGPQRLDGTVHVRESRGQVPDERRASLGARAGERCASAHAGTSPADSSPGFPASSSGRVWPRPNHSIAVPMSLSPRPDRLTRIVEPGCSSASWSAPAIACADSIAGMIPSVLDSSANASIACWSVIGRYVARPDSAR